MRPRFEDPIDTARDMVEKNITLIELNFYHQRTKNRLLSQNHPDFEKISENMITAKDFGEYEEFCLKYIIQNGTHAIMRKSLNHYLLKLSPKHMDGWWRSSETVYVGSKYSNYFSNKRWTLNEVNNNNFVMILI